MRNILHTGDEISINEKNYRIKGETREGSSYVVYDAERQLNGTPQNCLIKEFNPEGLDLERVPNGINRIVCNDQSKDEFDRSKKYIDFMIDLYNCDPNNTPFIVDASSDGGYLVLNWSKSSIFKQFKPRDVKELFVCVKAVAEIIGQYHAHGLLHLDIKPENIICFENKPDRVQIIDYDSMIKKDAQSGTVSIRFSNAWAASELIMGNIQQICEATDWFAVGELLYYKLFDDHSDLLERTIHGKFDFNKAELLEGSNPALLNKLTGFFRKTLCAAPSARYQKADDVISALDEMINLSGKPFLKDSLENAPACFVGRDGEMDYVHNKLSLSKYIFIEGMGGIGKTAFAVSYAHKYRDEYDVVCHTQSDDPVTEIKLVNYDSSEDRDWHEKLKDISSACERGKVLMIFDNAEKLNDDHPNSLIDKLSKELNCHKLFLTRNADSCQKQREKIKLEKLTESDALNIFKNYCPEIPENSESAVREIIEKFDRHTFFVELAAKTIRARGLINKIREISDKLMASEEKVISGKDGQKRRIYEHFQLMFDISKLNENESNTLKCLSMLPNTGIDKSYFDKEAKYELGLNLNDINALIDSGWIQEKNIDGKLMISLHPLVEELAEEALHKSSKCHFAIGAFLNGLTAYANNKSSCDDMINVISAVAQKLVNGRTLISADDKSPKIIDTPEAAELLVEACKVSGGFDAKVKRIEMAIEMHYHDRSHKKVLEAAHKLCEIYEPCLYEIFVDDNFLNCLNIALKLPLNEETLQLFSRMFHLTFFRFVKDGNHSQLDEWFHKFSKLSLEDACLIYEQASRETKYNTFVYNSSQKLNHPLFCEDPIKYKLNIARAEQNITERAAMFLNIARYAFLNGKKRQTAIGKLSFEPYYEVICECFVEMKDALKNEYGADKRIFELLDEGIGLLKEISLSEEDSDSVYIKTDNLITELESLDCLKSSASNSIGFQ